MSAWGGYDMSTYLSQELREGLEAARNASLKTTSRISVVAGEAHIPVLSLWRDGFSLEAANAPALRGLVDIYESGRHQYQCLIVASEEEGGEMRYEFKRSTEAQDRAPLDFYRDPDAPIALLGNG